MTDDFCVVGCRPGKHHELCGPDMVYDYHNVDSDVMIDDPEISRDEYIRVLILPIIINHELLKRPKTFELRNKCNVFIRFLVNDLHMSVLQVSKILLTNPSDIKYVLERKEKQEKFMVDFRRELIKFKYKNDL
jgi:hypothetical protein